MPRRVPQQDDDVRLTLHLPGSTEEWAEELLSSLEGVEVERNAHVIRIVSIHHGNADALANAVGFLIEVAEALAEGNISIMGFALTGVPVEREQG